MNKDPNQKNILRADNISVDIGAKEILHDVTLQINPGDKIGIVGENGVGKSTLLNVLAGQIMPRTGRVGGTENVYKMDQKFDLHAGENVRNFLERQAGVAEISRKMVEICDTVSKNPDETNLAKLAAIQEEYDNSGIYEFEERLDKMLGEMCEKSEILAKDFADLSGGQKQKIGILATTLTEKSIVLLDEPTNNLDASNKKLLENFVDNSDKGFAFVSHDRGFLRAVSRKMIELARGEITEYDMNYDEYEKARTQNKDAEIRAHEKGEKEKKKLERHAKALRVRENSRKGGGAKMSDHNKLAFNAHAGAGAKTADKSRQKMNEKLADFSVTSVNLDFSLDFAIAEKEGQHGQISVRNLTIDYGDKTISPRDFAIKVGERKHLVGENGAGKSSVIRAILGENPAIIGGEISRNPATKIGYIDQSQSVKNENADALANFAEMANEHFEEHDIRQLLIKFGIDKNDLVSRSVCELSSGQRMKLLLAALSVNRPGLIIMDEPTNNLDIATIEALESALAKYRGGILLASHDEEFVRNVGAEDLDIFR